MLLHIPDVLTKETLAFILKKLSQENKAWDDGRATAGYQGAAVKHNQQLAENDALSKELGDIIIQACQCHALFLSATLPNLFYPPLFNRYTEGMSFGRHVDGAIRTLVNTNQKIRTDISVTLFLSAPEAYEGGELVIEDAYGMHEVKLPAGDAIIYPATSLHEVRPITKGERVASIFWVESLVRTAAQRAILFDMDQAIQCLPNLTGVDSFHKQEDKRINYAKLSLTNCYHNLLRLWSHT